MQIFEVRPLVIGGLLLIAARCDLPGSAAQYQPTWESLDRHPVAAWWQDAKFGVYVHWSLASVPAWGNHSSFYWPNLLKSQKLEAAGPRAPKIDIAEEYVGLWQFHQKTYGAQFKYEDFAPLFRAEVFDADRWADLFARSGARYVVLTTKHHDGFCLWPSAEASRSWGRPWNAMDTGPKQDLVGALTSAVRKRGLKMGCYFSFFEWFNPLWLQDKPRFVSEHMLPQLKDLITRYQPDILWADGEWQGPDSLWHSREFLAWLFNESPVPDIVIDDRWGQGCRHKHGGFYTTAFTAGMADGRHAWEIWTFDPGYGDHPAVVVSAPDRAACKPLVEILLCSSQRASRAPNVGEVLLDSADGLNWETLCKCDLIYAVGKDLLQTRRGLVIIERRREIVRAIVASHAWSSI